MMYLNVVRKQGATVSIRLDDIKVILEKHQLLDTLGQDYKTYRTKMWKSFAAKNIPEQEKSNLTYIGEVPLGKIDDMREQVKHRLYREWTNRRQERQQKLKNYYESLIYDGYNVLSYNTLGIYESQDLWRAKKRTVEVSTTMPSHTVEAFLKEIAPIIKKYHRKGKVKTGWVPPGDNLPKNRTQVTDRYWNKL